MNSYYENSCYYTITYALSNKIRQIENDPIVAVAGEWFTAHELATDLGYFEKEENIGIAEKLKTAS